MPESVAREIESDGPAPVVLKTAEAGIAMAHFFVTSRAELAEQLIRVRGLLEPNGMIWVSWPKKAAKVRQR